MPRYQNFNHAAITSTMESAYSTLSGAINHSSRSGGRVRVPQDKLQSRSNGVHNHYPILFGKLQGVNMGDIIASDGKNIDNPNFCAFNFAVPTTAINFCISWPGYNKWQRHISVISERSGTLMTRAELAVAISRQIMLFLNAALRGHEMQVQRTNWPIGGHGITFNRLFLVGLNNVQDNVWQADIMFE